MAKKSEQTPAAESVNIPAPKFIPFNMWIVGDTPLICHAWSEKAKRQMLDKQQQRPNPHGKGQRDPEQDFVDSLYEMPAPEGEQRFGFPATALKQAIVQAAHKDKGVARVAVRSALWIDHNIVQVRPALAGARCNMPLIQIYGAPPVMREDMVRVGSGMSKTATLAYRSEFWPWAFRVTGRMNAAVLNSESLGYLVLEAGMSFGIGEWRAERNGTFGAFHPAAADEASAWERFRAGRGPLPQAPGNLAEAAD